MQQPRVAVLILRLETTQSVHQWLRWEGTDGHMVHGKTYACVIKCTLGYTHHACAE